MKHKLCAPYLVAVNLLRMLSRPPARAATFVADRVGYAVGDIHGRADLLEKMFETFEARAAEDTRAGGPPLVIFLGDYIDRGADSAKVIDMLLSSRPEGCERRYLRGNHEQTMIAFMANPKANRAWLLQGGVETLLSYGVTPPSPVGATDEEWDAVATAMAAAVPQAHIDFLNGLERYVALGDYAFVHAGVDASRTLEDQTDADLYWIRAPFIASKRPFSHRVVHGHTPVDRPYADHRRIAVDTGAYASGTLSAVRLEGEEIGFLSVSDRPVRAR